MVSTADAAHVVASLFSFASLLNCHVMLVNVFFLFLTILLTHLGNGHDDASTHKRREVQIIYLQ